jgi:16S rRNA (cytidine1402-2'-O)-methyltransferase
MVKEGDVEESESGILYIVATPIGNLGDFSARAVETLRKVDLIAAEDTRHSRPLLEHYGIAKRMVSLHEHNEEAGTLRLIDRLAKGEAVALISDAGTPLVSDPGFPLVRLARERGIRVTPVPGPCALIAALSASGLPSDRFAFEGFPPRTASARRSHLEALVDDPRTLIFYESSHRVLEFMRDIGEIFPAQRRIVIARELTKLYETIVETAAGDAADLIEADSNMRKGEFVILVHGATATKPRDTLTHDQSRVLQLLLGQCSVKTAAALTAKITGARREVAYQAALRLAEKHR